MLQFNLQQTPKQTSCRQVAEQYANAVAACLGRCELDIVVAGGLPSTQLDRRLTGSTSHYHRQLAAAASTFGPHYTRPDTKKVKKANLYSALL